MRVWQRTWRIVRGVWRIARAILPWAVVAGMIAVGIIISRPGEKGGNQSNFAGPDQQPKRLAVFLDGTWNLA